MIREPGGFGMKETTSKMGRLGGSGRTRLFLLLPLLAATAGACRLDMHQQPRYEPYDESPFFADGRASRVPPAGTVARGQLREDRLFYTGLMDGRDSELFPGPVTREMLERGRERYDIYCSPCHDRVGTGQGVIVRRGMRQPASLHIVRLREAPPGYFFNVITHGFATMYAYASRIPPEDRWAIVAYIRALQLSQGAGYGEVSEEDIARVEAGN